MKKLFLSAMVLGGVFTTQAFNSENDKTPKNAVEVNAENKEDTPTIVGVAVGNENFSTLVAAVKAAGLVETLNSDGPFTVFAPTNDAFGKLPAGTIDNLLKPESKDVLTAVLTYHVVAGEFKAADVVKAIQDNGGSFTITTVQGTNLTASLEGDKVVLTDAKGGKSTVVLTDVAASNGVIHAIDTVVMP